MPSRRGFTRASANAVATVYRGGLAHWLGDGFPVRTLLSRDELGSKLGPIALLNYAGPVRVQPVLEQRGVQVRAAQGLDVVTVLYSGELEYRDSIGTQVQLSEGDVHIVSTASAVDFEVLHSRSFAEHGGVLEALQLWVNSSAQQDDARPYCQLASRPQFPHQSLSRDAGELRVLVGQHGTVRAPIATCSDLALFELALNPGGSMTLPVPADESFIVAVLHGEVRLDGTLCVAEAETAVLEPVVRTVSMMSKIGALALVIHISTIGERPRASVQLSRPTN